MPLQMLPSYPGRGSQRAEKCSMTLVSAILPTRGRQAYAQQAVKDFINQTYPSRELVILDDLEERSFPNGALDIPRCYFPVVYLMHNSRSIAEKRNLCCQYANGEVIVHWDSDDHSEPARIQSQVDFLEKSERAVAGFHSLLFHVAQDGRWLKYCGDPSYALGTSLMYRKAFWKAHPFRSPSDTPHWGEDNNFVRDARQAGELVTVDGDTLMYARIHDSNTSIKDIGGAQTSYRHVPIEAIPQHLR